MHISRILNAAKHREILSTMQSTNANEAARNWIMVEFEEENPVFPYISDINDIETEAGDIVRNISVNIRFYEGWDE